MKNVQNSVVKREELFLLFAIRREAFLIQTRHIVEILPLVPFKTFPYFPSHISGVFSHRGQLLSCLDLAILFYGVGDLYTLSSRILVVRGESTKDETQSEAFLFGWLVSQVQTTLHLALSDLRETCPRQPLAHYLEGVFLRGDELLPLLSMKKIFSDPLHSPLFLPVKEDE